MLETENILKVFSLMNLKTMSSPPEMSPNLSVLTFLASKSQMKFPLKQSREIYRYSELRTSRIRECK